MKKKKINKVFNTTPIAMNLKSQQINRMSKNNNQKNINALLKEAVEQRSTEANATPVPPSPPMPTIWNGPPSNLKANAKPWYPSGNKRKNRKTRKNRKSRKNRK